MRETIPIHDALTRWLPQAALVAAAIALTGCTMTPWTDSWQPARAGTHVGRDAGRDRRLLPRESGRYARGRRERLRAARPDVASWNHMAPTDAVYPGQARVAPPPAATSLGQPPAAAAQPGLLARPATGVVATPFSAGKTRGLVIAASGA